MFFLVNDQLSMYIWSNCMLLCCDNSLVYSVLLVSIHCAVVVLYYWSQHTCICNVRLYSQILLGIVYIINSMSVSELSEVMSCIVESLVIRTTTSGEQSQLWPAVWKSDASLFEFSCINRSAVQSSCHVRLTGKVIRCSSCFIVTTLSVLYLIFNCLALTVNRWANIRLFWLLVRLSAVWMITFHIATSGTLE